MPALRVLIVDDSRPFLAAARRLLERECLQVLESAASSADAMRLAGLLHPDVVLVDVMLGGESGLELACRLVAQDGPGGGIGDLDLHSRRGGPG